MANPVTIVVTPQNDAVIVNGVTHNIGTLETVAGNRRSVFGTFQFPNVERGGYATGGIACDPTQFDLGVLDRLECEDGKSAEAPSLAITVRLKTATPLKGSYNPATPQGLIQAFWCAGTGAPLTEVDDDEDISAYVVPFTAYGVA